jgi:5'-3' exonuclease
MGIKKLFTFLNNNKLYKIYPYITNLLEDLDLKKLDVIIGVDGNLFCYKYSHSYDNMLIGFFNQIIQFLSNGIIPLYIFDGGTLNEKETTNQNRNNKKQINKSKIDIIDNKILNNIHNTELILLKKKLEKNSIRISINEINILLELLDLLNIPYIFSHGEGEYLAVLLNQYNIIDMLLTDDTDPIPAGIKKIIKFYNNNVYYLETTTVLEKLKLTKNQFCDFCILLGTDYLTYNHKIKPNELYDQIIVHLSIEELVNNNIINIEDINVINNIRNIYFESANNEKTLFLNPDSYFSNYNKIIDHSNFNYYSNILLEFWDDFIFMLKDDIKNNEFKKKITSYIKKNKFNIKNIIKFLKNNITDINENELSNVKITFEYLNKFSF